MIRCVERRRGGGSKGDIWWWNEEVKEAVSRKEDAHKVVCWDHFEENKRRYEIMKNRAKKAVSKAMRKKAEEPYTELNDC